MPQAARVGLNYGMINASPETVRRVVTWAAFGFVVGWLIYQSLRKADDVPKTAFKWLFTVILVALMAWKIPPMMDKGGMVAADGLFYTLFAGLALAITWRHNIASMVAKPFGSLYDGGDVPPEPRPAYSIAQSRQKQGKYLEAISEVQKQLERFPTDFEGHMLMAQIQAEDLKDLPAAEQTVQELCAQPGHAPKNIAFALYSLADWQLKVAHDAEAARRALEQIPALLPETEFALAASQRLAHLANAEAMLAPHDQQVFTVPQAPRRLGLARGAPSAPPLEQNPADRAAELVKHLEQYPNDTDAREQLAKIYAEHYGRMDLATEELEQLIQQPHQPSKLVARWLNLLADLQIRSGADHQTVRRTLERIIEHDPKFSAAETARKRIDLLKLELKGKQEKPAVRLGSYEQHLGLKMGNRAGLAAGETLQQDHRSDQRS